jgi:hypothetical protein
VEGHGVVNGDRLDQRLASSRRREYQLVSIHNDMWSMMLLLSGWQVGVCLSLGVEPKVVDGADVEQLVLTPMISGLSLRRLMVVELSRHLGKH